MSCGCSRAWACTRPGPEGRRCVGEDDQRWTAEKAQHRVGTDPRTQCAVRGRTDLRPIEPGFGEHHGPAQELALKGRLGSWAIHQPSSDIFKMFDRLLLMDQEGHPVYYGDPVEAVVYFKQVTGQVAAQAGQCSACGNEP